MSTVSVRNGLPSPSQEMDRAILDNIGRQIREGKRTRDNSSDSPTKNKRSRYYQRAEWVQQAVARQVTPRPRSQLSRREKISVDDGEEIIHKKSITRNCQRVKTRQKMSLSSLLNRSINFDSIISVFIIETARSCSTYIINSTTIGPQTSTRVQCLQCIHSFFRDCACIVAVLLLRRLP